MHLERPLAAKQKEVRADIYVPSTSACDSALKGELIDLSSLMQKH